MTDHFRDANAVHTYKYWFNSAQMQRSKSKQRPERFSDV